MEPRDCTCHECGEKFTKFGNMKRHQQRVHEGVKTTCSICQKRVSNIDKHRKVHKNRDLDEDRTISNSCQENHNVISIKVPFVETMNCDLVNKSVLFGLQGKDKKEL